MVLGDRLYFSTQPGTLYCFSAGRSHKKRSGPGTSAARPPPAPPTTRTATSSSPPTPASSGPSTPSRATCAGRTSCPAPRRSSTARRPSTAPAWWSPARRTARSTASTRAAARRSGPTPPARACTRRRPSGTTPSTSAARPGASGPSTCAPASRSGPSRRSSSNRYPGPIFGSASVLNGIVYFSSFPAPGAEDGDHVRHRRPYRCQEVALRRRLLLAGDGDQHRRPAHRPPHRLRVRAEAERSAALPRRRPFAGLADGPQRRDAARRRRRCVGRRGYRFVRLDGATSPRAALAASARSRSFSRSTEKTR